jgi:hypothetical protein
VRVSTAFAYQTAIDAMNDRQSKGGAPDRAVDRAQAAQRQRRSDGRRRAERTRSAQRRIETDPDERFASTI